MKKVILLLSLALLGVCTQAQNGLENITVEKYYISTAADAAGSSGTLPVGSVTYRIYADMLPGYKFQMAYGNANHNLKFTTTTSFFNNTDYGSITPSYSKTNAAKNTVMLDSWLSVGAACSGNFGIMKSEDNGVSNVVNTNGLLTNTDSRMGIPLTTQDGIIAGAPQSVTFVGITNETDVFGDGTVSGNSFVLDGEAWSALSGATGPTTANKVLIAQITTNGIFHYELNIQIGTPTGGTENYVVSNPVMFNGQMEKTIASLTGTFNPPIVASIVVPDSVAHIAQIITVPITTTALNADNNAISYQFDLAYNSSKLNYVSSNLTGTIASGGTLVVNSSTAGLLHISLARATAFTGNGPLLNLQFNPSVCGTIPLTLSNFLFNTDTMHSITNGEISAIGMYGDIDTNLTIQAYDAALALQYSVGLDPLPISDPRPWEDWRMVVADVDGVSPVSANDASLILQHSAGLISTFPAESAKSLENPVGDVTISQNGANIIFTSTGELYGLNIFATNGSLVTMNAPVVLDPDMMVANNISGSTYNVGVCTATPPADNTNIISIPYTCAGDETLTFNLVINKTAVVKTLNVSCLTTGIEENQDAIVSLYPNPASDILNIKVSENSNIQILDLSGKQIILEATASDNQKQTINVNNLSNGVYLLKVFNDNFVKIQKIVINK
jgi:hypothetical protein